MRDAGNILKAYDLPRMKDAIRDEGRPFTLFGGEPLLMDRSDIEEMWRWGLEHFGGNSIQTNGTLIDDDFVRMFKRYKVQVGLSIDGPGELNDARWCGSLENTRRSTARVEAVIDMLCREGIPPSIIVTLSRTNAASRRLEVLCGWIRTLDAAGIRRMRLHILESESGRIRDSYGLSESENLQAFSSLARLENELINIRFDVFDDIRNMLLGRDDRATCTWTGCDPYTTGAVTGITGNGDRSNCGRTNKDGIDYTKADEAGFERYLALYLTPQDAGGCRDCRFFLQCKGQCPGTSLEGDWRNRSEHCGVWMGLYQQFEHEMVQSGLEPISLSPRRPALEQAFMSAWAAGNQPSLAALLESSGDGVTPNQTLVALPVDRYTTKGCS